MAKTPAARNEEAPVADESQRSPKNENIDEKSNILVILNL